jgi:tRNA (adenine37-N6)-methyltransferase
VEGTVLPVAGLDAIDGTAVLDIKPVMREFRPARHGGQPAWAGELMAHHWAE